MIPNSEDDIEIDVDGKVVKGRYVVSRSMITVYGPTGSVTTQLGGSAGAPASLARMILREIVERDR